MEFKALYSMDKNIFILGLFINGWSILRFLKTIHGILFSHGSLLNLSAWDMFSIISAILKSASWEKTSTTCPIFLNVIGYFDEGFFWRLHRIRSEVVVFELGEVELVFPSILSSHSLYYATIAWILLYEGLKELFWVVKWSWNANNLQFPFPPFCAKRHGFGSKSFKG